MTTVAALDKSQLDNTILFMESDNVYIADNGMAKAEFHPIGNKVNFHSKGFSVAWKPNAMKYVDEFGMEDTIYSVQDAPLEVKGNKARFDRSFPDVDDMFIVDGDRLKHTIIVQGWQRDPVPWLSENIDFVISGRLEFDPSLSVHSMGMNLIGPFETGESIEIRNEGEVIFALPKIVAYDSDIPLRAEAFGRYRVTANENGSLSFDIVMDNAWMSDPERVYPLLIDPTVVVSGTYDTSTNGARKVVALSNGWVVASVYESVAGTPVHFFVSKDKGTTWTKLTTLKNAGNQGYSITSFGTKIFVLYRYSLTTIKSSSFDALTVGSEIDAHLGTVIVSSETDANLNTSLAINSTGTELHAAWSSKNSTYPNSFNIRYAKGTIDGSGNVTWRTAEQCTTDNATNVNHKNPCIVIKADGNPCILREWSDTNLASYQIRALNYNGSSWAGINAVYTGGSYAQSNPCAVVDGNGAIHVGWIGKDSTDPSVFNVRYSRSTDGGVTWSTAVKLTTGNASQQDSPPSLYIGMNNKVFVVWGGFRPGGGLSRNIRIISNDGTGWSAITELQEGNLFWSPSVCLTGTDAMRYIFMDLTASSIKFDSITFNIPPTAPTNLSPNGTSIDRAQIKRLSWQHNDTAGDGQSKFDLQWRTVGSGTWNTVTQTTPNQYWDAPANTFPRGNIEWQVRTYDQANVVGPYSAQVTFFAGNKPTAPTILEPNGTIPVSRPNVSWSSADQSSYQVQALDGASTVWDTGEVVNGNKVVTVGIDLTNNKTYTFKVRTKNADGVWSDWTQVSRLVSYTPPATPIVTVTPQNEKMLIQITNPTPIGSQPSIAYNNLYRKKTSESVWVRIATNIPNNGALVDYTVASGVYYDYKVETIGNNETITESAVQTQKTVFLGIWLHCVDDPKGTLHRFALSNGNSDEWSTDGSLMKFAGRTRPVAEFGEVDDGRITANIQMLKGRGDREALQRIVQRKTTVCYRDNRGRKMFGVIFQLPSNDAFYGYSVTISIDEIDFKEDV